MTLALALPFRRIRFVGGRWSRMISRVLVGVLSLAIIVTIVFLLAGARDPRSIAIANLPPGVRDPVSVATYIKVHQLDRPFVARLFSFAGGLLHGNLGSTANDVPVTSLVMPAFWATVRLVVPAFVITVVLGIALGSFLAEHAGSRADRLITGVLAIGDSIPAFVIGVGVLFLFAVKAGWFQISSQLAITYGSPTEQVEAYVLPMVSLVLLQAPYAAKLCRSAFADVQELPMTRSAMLRGLSPSVIRWRCVLPNTGSLLAHSFGLMAATMVAGSLIIENIYSFPGIGRLSVLSIGTGDQPTLIGIVVATSIWLITLSTLSDVLAVSLNPKLRAP
ncbi:MAG: transporter permease [Pseudonocardiales bacterium]|nr:transporter permease [Pseudonocardiales bacterium]